eukprot:TRINITY_DN9614_c0_g1_i1.p1 TRINITY_DN9614_c0_g1~~TRINITY_DN9614_c0_g1_i1.p1  ORF type:complete len:159 (-),score=41.36 TRINITY_DN9614_c0_g1_i1:1-453(-)
MGCDNWKGKHKQYYQHFTMTISYQQQVATSSGLGVFWKLLFKWKGSIYKLVWQNLFVYMVLYYALSITYRFGLNDTGKKKFEQIPLHCQMFAELIPVTFVLGFYVSIIITRWWVSIRSSPGQTLAASSSSTCIRGHDDRELMRRTIRPYT